MAIFDINLPQMLFGAEDWDSLAVAKLSLSILVLAALINLLDLSINVITVPTALRRRQSDMQIEIAELKRQAKFLNTPDTFAQCAKMERKALALEKNLARLQEQESKARSSSIRKVPTILRVTFFVLTFFLSLKVPVAVALKPQWVWPLGSYLAMRTGTPVVIGFIGLFSWADLCSRASHAFLSQLPLFS